MPPPGARPIRAAVQCTASPESTPGGREGIILYTGKGGVGKTTVAAATAGPARLLSTMTRQWERNIARRLSPEFTAHMRAATREVFLALAALSESALRAAEARTTEARRRVERIPVDARPAVPRRATGRRKR